MKLPRLPRYLLAVLGSLTALLPAGCVRKQFFQADARPGAPLAGHLPAGTDSVRDATAGRHYARHGRLYEALVGRHYRRVWAAPVATPVLRLARARPGGLQPGKVGGGFNSTSLNLTAPDGRAYVLRTVDKDPIRATPALLRGTFLVNGLRDNISAINPYAALVVPPLAAAVGVPHTSPRLYYVRPDDPAFQGDSLRLFRGQLAYLEEKTAPPADAPSPDRPAVVSSVAAFAAVLASPAQRLHQPALLRARLFDGWLGDWDRHAGQWNWAVYPAGPAGYAAVHPLPKDRDMTFYRVDDGVLGWLLGHVFQPHWTTFGPRYPRARHLFSSGRYLDARGLNALTRADFGAAARRMQQHLSDSLIGRAVRRLPPAAFALEGARLDAALRARRAALPALADAFYRQLARRPVVGGTAQAERFEVHRYADSTVVLVRASLAATVPVVYRRAFFAAETRRLQLEALAGDDVVVVEAHGTLPAKRPRLRVYGGAGADELPARRRGVRLWPGSAPARHAYNRLPEE